MDAILGIIVAVALAGCAQAAPRPPAADDGRADYSGRDGAAEAQADVRAGRPLKIYSTVFNGFIPGFRSPGLANCHPYGGVHAPYVSMPEAGFQEGEPLPTSIDARRRADAAFHFAVDYNRAVLRLRRSEVETLCPDVTLDEMP